MAPSGLQTAAGQEWFAMITVRYLVRKHGKSPSIMCYVYLKCYKNPVGRRLKRLGVVYPENNLTRASGLWYSSNISGLFTFLNHFQGGRMKETKIIHVSIVRNSLTVMHSVRKSCDKWDTFDPPLRLGVGIETFSVSPEFHSMALAYRPVQCRRNVLNCGRFDREKKSKSQKVQLRFRATLLLLLHESWFEGHCWFSTTDLMRLGGTPPESMLFWHHLSLGSVKRF